jgi:hypothetical protein
VLRLRENLHWCECDGRAVFLDTREDKYFCLPRQANDAFLDLSRHPASAQLEHLQPLLSRGLLIDGHGGAIGAPAQIERPTSDWLQRSPRRAGAIAISHAIASELIAARYLRKAPLQQVLDRVRALSATAEPLGSDVIRSVRRIAEAEAWASFIMRSHNRCLVRALAVHSLCRKAGAPTKLVFGVVAHPFSAHCWVQLGSAVIVGGYEQARLHTPILVIA